VNQRDKTLGPLGTEAGASAGAGVAVAAPAAELPKLKLAGCPATVKVAGLERLSLDAGAGPANGGLPLLSAAPLRSLSPGRARPF
jgi:hypothetical protein